MTTYDNDFFILHGEDDFCDIRVMEIILKNIKFQGDYKNLSIGQDILTWISDTTQPKLPSLLILDIGLPGVDGKEILRTLRKEPKSFGLPIIMMSGSNSKRDYEECIALGASAYIQKTSDLDFLETTLKCFIDGWSRLRSQTFY